MIIVSQQEVYKKWVPCKVESVNFVYSNVVQKTSVTPSATCRFYQLSRQTRGCASRAVCIETRGYTRVTRHQTRQHFSVNSSTGTVNSGVKNAPEFTGRELGPWTRVVETGLYTWWIRWHCTPWRCCQVPYYRCSDNIYMLVTIFNTRYFTCIKNRLWVFLGLSAICIGAGPNLKVGAHVRRSAGYF